MNYEPLIGIEVHGYQIEHKIGEGGMGKVFRARHHGIDRVVVVKTLIPEYATNEPLRQRFVREARIVASLDHPNIITVENFGQLPSGELFLIMPLLQGRPLDEVLNAAGKLGPHHALSIAAQIGSALQHAHAHGIVHRDLKPGNVFLERKGNQDVAKLLDFGIAKDAQAVLLDSKAQTKTGSALGTPRYMAVEQYDDAASVTAAVDIFALAVMIVEMLTAELPWGLDPGGVLYYRQRTQAPALGPEIPRAWVPILLAALSPDPARRPASARALIIALANELPAMPPVWGTGAKVVKDYAPDLITEALPADETVKARGNAPMSSIAVYPSLVTPSGLGESSSNAHGGPTPAPYAHGAPAAAPSTPATANERPQHPQAIPTTLSALSGSTTPPPHRRRRRAIALAAIGLGAAALSTLVAFALARSRGTHSNESGQTSAAPASTIVPDASATAAVLLDATEPVAITPIDAGVEASAAPDSAVKNATATASTTKRDTTPLPPRNASVETSRPARTTNKPPRVRTNVPPVGRGSGVRDTVDPDEIVE